MRRKFFIAILTVMLFYTLCGCNVRHGARVLEGEVTTAWRQSHLTYGAFDTVKEDYDATSPKDRTVIVKDADTLAEIFVQPPQINFEKQTVIIYCYTDIYTRSFILKRAEIIDGTMYIDFKIANAEMRGCEAVGDAHMPGTLILAITVDRADITAAKVTYLKN